MIVYRKEIPFESSGNIAVSASSRPGNEGNREAAPESAIPGSGAGNNLNPEAACSGKGACLPADSASYRKMIPENSVFLDIETSGLSSRYHFVYCIGLAYFKENGAVIVQYFAKSRADEPELLQAMLEFLETRDPVLVTYNGARFDLPFLEARCRLHGLHFDSSRLPQIDLLREIRPLQKLFGLSRLRQKDIERFLGICREDQYDGGKLIEVYLQYEQTGSKNLRRLLLLHNFDDMKGMLSILPILSYRKLADGDFKIHTIFFEDVSGKQAESSCKKCSFCASEAEAAPENPLQGENQPVEPASRRSGSGDTGVQKYSAHSMLCFRIFCDYPLPRPVSRKNDSAEISLEKDKGIIKIPVFRGTMKYFFPDYKNYYYLPREDAAVHRSVGQFTDPAFREPARKETCYVKKEGFFLPIGNDVLENAPESSGKNILENTTSFGKITAKQTEKNGPTISAGRSSTTGGNPAETAGTADAVKGTPAEVKDAPAAKKHKKKSFLPEKFFGFPLFYPSYRDRLPCLDVTELKKKAEAETPAELTDVQQQAFREILKEVLIR